MPEAREMSGSLWRIGAAFLLNLLITVAGLNVTYPLPAPWSNPAACGDSLSAPNPHIQNRTLCDPDHMLSIYQRELMTELLASCRADAVVDLRMIVFFASNVTFIDDRASNTKESPESKLLSMVVSSYNLTSEPPVILVVAIRNQFKMDLWQSRSISYLVTKEDREEALRIAKEVHAMHYHLVTSVSHGVRFLCQKVSKDANAYGVKYILFTITWVVFVTVFVLGIFFTAICLIRVRRSRFKDGPSDDDLRSSTARPGSMDVTDVSVVSYRSRGHVLLGARDITAVSAQNCASTDNLLQS